MRCLVALLLLLTPALAPAQGDLSKLLAQGLDAALKSLQPVAPADREDLLMATAIVLSKHVTFRPDDTAAACCNSLGKQHVEWRKLVVSAIRAQPVTDADRLNGITRRFFVSFSCSAHRTFDPKTSLWSEWKSVGYSQFPPGIEIEWKNGKWTPKAESLKAFTPGPGPSILQRNPQTNDAGLPPGMTRGKPVPRQ